MHLDGMDGKLREGYDVSGIFFRFVERRKARKQYEGSVSKGDD